MKWFDAWKEPLAWTGGGVGAVVVFLILTFPYGALQTRIIGEVQRRSGMDIRSTQWTVGFPATLEWRNLTLSKPDWGAVQLALLQAKLGLMKILVGELGIEILIQADAASPNAGVATGSVTGSSLALDGPLSVKGRLQQVDVPTFARPYVSRGTLSGEFLQRLDAAPVGSSAIKGDGVWKAEIRDLAVDQLPLNNGLTLSVGFARIAAALSCRDAVCDVTELKGEGPDGSFSGEGKIVIQRPMQDSQVVLSMTIVPGAGFASKAAALGIPPLPPGVPMTVKVLGTLAQTRIAL